MSEKKKKKKNKKMINVDEESAEDVKMKRIIKKKFSKKENLDTMMFGVVGVKNPNAVIFMKYYIDDTTTILDSFTKEKSSKKNENGSSKKNKNESSKKNENESFEKAKEKKTGE